MFFSVPKLLTSFKEWWFRPKNAVIEMIEKNSEAFSDCDSDYDSDYLCSGDDDIDGSHVSSLSFPAFGKKTYCGAEIVGPDHYRIHFPVPKVAHDPTAFCDLEDM